MFWGSEMRLEARKNRARVGCFGGQRGQKDKKKNDRESDMRILGVMEEGLAGVAKKRSRTEEWEEMERSWERGVEKGFSVKGFSGLPCANQRAYLTNL